MKNEQLPATGISIDFFTKDPTVEQEIQSLLDHIQAQKEADPEYSFSDVRDDAGNCYVDLVQEGGGVLGIALVGYTYALEKAGIRFLKMAGTSAGAINTIMLAAADKPAAPKSEKILQAIAGIDILSFVDGDKDAKKFFESLIERKSKLNLFYRGVQVIDNFKNFLGLNPGEVFYEWLADTIESYGIRTVKDLRERMEDLPAEIKEVIYPPDTAEARKDDWPFALVAADITTESKTIMPRHGALYFEHPEEVHPAYYVRASMAVPLFFHPLHRDPARFVDKHPYLGQPIPKDHSPWESELHYKGNDVPDKVMFVDGGILSNFPIDIFHNWDKVPRRPTFGVKLGLPRSSYNDVDNMSTFGLVGAVFNAARNMRDAEYIYNNPELKQLVGEIDTQGQDWLNFALSDEDKLTLFRQGVIAGVEFLTKKFNWKNYKADRRTQLLSFVDRLSHDLSLLDEAEAKRPVSRDLDLSAAEIREQKEAMKKSQRALRERLSAVKVLCDKVDILWVDNGYNFYQGKEEKLPEIRFLENLDGEYEIHCVTVEQARAALRENKGKYDLAVFYTKLEDEVVSNATFLEEMVTALKKEQSRMPPAIFYFPDYDSGMGTPPYAFGITHSPTELMHLIVDVLQRKM
jgi:NTE family protein